MHAKARYINMMMPDWFYDGSHVVEEEWEKAAMTHTQAGLTWWENGPVSPRSDVFRRLRDGGHIPDGEISWHSSQDQRKLDGQPASVGDVEVHAYPSGAYVILTAIRIVARENQTTRGLVVQVRVIHA